MIGIKEKSDIKSWLEKGEQNVVLTMSDSLTVLYVQVMIMVIELEKLSSQELQNNTVLLEWTVTKLWKRVSYILTALELNKYTVQKNVCILYRNIFILHIHYIHTLQVCMSTSDIFIYYIGWSCQSPNTHTHTHTQEIQGFRWEFFVQLAQRFLEM